MPRKTLFLLGGLLVFSCLDAVADDGHVFPVEGKTYLVHRYNNENSYMYESGNVLMAGPSSTTQKQYWQFIPTENPNCYYIQNATTKRYVQSTNLGCVNDVAIQVSVGKEPVEFQIVKNETNNPPKGYYYMCSTDQTINASQDGTLGLNFQESTQKVVAYHIRWNRGNSYWNLKETSYDYVAPVAPERTPLSKRLGIYNLPCGVKGTAYLTSLSVTGKSISNPLNYTATAQPSDYYHMERKDSAVVFPEAELNFSFEAAGMGKDYTATFYFDWNGDGVFETKHDCFNTSSDSFTLTLPKDAELGKRRMRVRLNDNGLEDAEDDVNGLIYDFQLLVEKKDIVESIEDPIANPPQTNELSDRRAYNIEGKPVCLDSHEGPYIQSGQKRIK